jgi:hypothetical protein
MCYPINCSSPRPCRPRLLRKDLVEAEFVTHRERHKRDSAQFTRSTAVCAWMTAHPSLTFSNSRIFGAFGPQFGSLERVLRWLPQERI